MTDGADLWEQHAAWWQEGFTEGADPEYEEQILPLAAEHLAGAVDVLDVGCGEGQVARLATAIGARRAVGVDPTWDQIEVAAAAGRRAGLRRRRRRRRSRSRTAPSTPSSPASCSSTSATSTTPSPRWPGCCDRAGGSCSSSTTRCCRRPTAAGSTTRSLDPPEQYWRIGPYLVEDETVEEVEKGVFIPFIHRPLSAATSTRMAANGLVARAHGRAGAAAGLPRPAPRSTRRRPASRGSCSSAARRAHLSVLRDRRGPAARRARRYAGSP